MQVDQALRALSILKDSAPKTTSARLGDVIALLSQLDEENAALSAQLSTPVSPLSDLLPPALDTLRPSLLLVRGQAESLRAGKLGRLTTEQADCLKSVAEHANSALTLLNTLDELMLLRQGTLHVEQAIFSGLDLLAEAWQRCYSAAERRDHHVSIHADDPLPNVQGDPDYVLSILVDLLDNAIHYTPVGGAIRLTAEMLGSHVLFTVADNGIGLNAADLEQIGQPYWRATHQALVREHPGSGLRLFRAQQILALHGSEILFSGEPGRGSTFSFALRCGAGGQRGGA